MHFGMNFWKAMYQVRQETRKRERSARIRAGLPRVDRDVPFNLKIGNIVTLKSLYAYAIPAYSLLDADSVADFIDGAVINNYGRMEMGPDVIHRAYFNESDQEYMLQVAVDRKGAVYQDLIYLFMLQGVYTTDVQAYIDHYIADGSGVLGDPAFALAVEGMDEPLRYDTVWGSPDGWTKPEKASELIYDDPVDNPMVRISHLIGLYSRSISADGPDKEYALMTASYFYDNWKALPHNFDRLAMLTYIGLKLHPGDFDVLNQA